MFFITSLSLTYLYSSPAEQQGVMDKVNPAAVQQVPAVDVTDDSKSGEIPK
jgi:preprotein translocase subunit SecG